MDLALFSRCALFVSNKWDLIDDKEREEVKKAQIETLTRRLISSLDPKSQIVYLSCKNAQLAQEYGVITEDFNDFITGISNLVVSSMQNNLLMCCRCVKIKHKKDKLSNIAHFYLSCKKKGKDTHEYGVITDDFNDLITGISYLAPRRTTLLRISGL